MLVAGSERGVLGGVSKSASKEVMGVVLEAAEDSGKPVVVNVLGESRTGQEGRMVFTATLEETAEAALRLAGAGLGVILDIVPNHMAAVDQSPFWPDL